MIQRLAISLEPSMSQDCGLCFKRIVSEHQLPLNAIVIYGYGICPSCRQVTSSPMQRDQQYRRKWRRFVKSMKLDT